MRRRPIMVEGFPSMWADSLRRCIRGLPARIITPAISTTRRSPRGPCTPHLSTGHRSIDRRSSLDLPFTGPPSTGLPFTGLPFTRRITSGETCHPG